MAAARTSAVIWVTGLSGAGKSTLAEAVVRALRERAVPTELLDGDAVRALSPTGFEPSAMRTCSASASWSAGSSTMA